ncbi:MAG: tyrosine-protein phosphatase [Ruminococcus sp.]|jgi:protein-tyrosine phosphatase|nr:tyrosine-protein phosphatase [Ruminococcus sp.]
MRYYKRLPLEGMSNCRDLGGYPTKYGKITNFGVFVRSEAPVELSDRDVNFLKKYGIKKSLDFRGEKSILDFPSSLDTVGVEYIRLPMFGRADSLGFADGSDDPSRNFTGWGKSYIQWLECYKGWIKDVFGHLAYTDGVVQYNCNAGKDRTGIISALVLAISGAEMSDIAFDYCISRTMLKPRFKYLVKQWDDFLKNDDDKLIINHPFLFTPREAMYQMFKYINSEYKNAENYLRSCGVDERQIYEIRRKMIGD